MRSLCLLFSFLIVLSFLPTSQQAGCPNVGISQKTLDENVIQVEWFNNEKYVYAVTKTSVYVSKDEGQTWDKKELGTGTISELFRTADEKKQFALEYENKVSTLWRTSDHGSTWQSVKIDEQIFDVYPHPTDANWAVGHSFSQGCLTGTGSCIQNIYLTQDFGDTWRKLSEGIHRFSWGNAGKDGVPKQTAFQLRAENPGSMRTGATKFERTSNLFKSVDVTVSNALDFGLYYGTLYVAQWISLKVKLLVSNDGGDTLKIARFPGNLDERSYTIINDIAGLSYIAVDHSSPSSQVRWANIYVTDFSSDAYVLSQEYVAKDRVGKVDFSGINLDGVQIANVYKLDQEPAPTSNSIIRSVITWDNGGQWNAIDGPADSCPDGSAQCDIHFQGRSSGFAIESSSSAVGMIVATGNTGDLLDDDALNTYISRDAGLTWKKIAQGTKVYEFSDHGGLLLLAEDEWPTKSVLYSWDKGTSFTNCTFGDKDHLITWIGTAPSGTSQNYLVVQSDTDSSGKPLSIITHLDFSTLHQTECGESDYEWWKPSDGASDFCLLGREIEFKRRKADAQCFNPENYETKKVVTYCQCTREDYGCDYCYEEDDFTTSNGECKLSCSYDPATPPADCSGHYKKTQGYRLVAGDQCQGGLNLNPQTCDCQGQNCVNTEPTTTTTTGGSTTGSSGGGSSGASAGTVVGIMFLILLIFAVLTGLIVFYLYRNNEQVRNYVDDHMPSMSTMTSWFGRSSGQSRSNVEYSTLDPSNSENVEVDPFVDEEEATELNDQQIVQMKVMNSQPETDSFNPRGDSPSQPPSLI